MDAARQVSVIVQAGHRPQPSSPDSAPERRAPKSVINGGKTGVGANSNRMSYPREFKLLVIGYYFNNGQNKYRTCKEFQITKSMLNGWLHKVEKIQQSRPGSLKSGRSGRKPQFPQVETELYKVYLTHLAQGRKVGNRWLRDTAKCIAQRCCTQEELNGMCQFSERWLCNFKKRFNVNLTKDWGEQTGSPEMISPVSKCQTSVVNRLTDEVDRISSDCSLDKSSTPDTTVVDDHFPLQPIDSPTIVVVRKPEDRLQRRAPNTAGNPHPGKRGRKVQFPQVESALYKKLLEKQAVGDRVSNRWLQVEARRLAGELYPQMFADQFKSVRCTFSEHWLHNFKKRYDVTLKHSGMNNSVATTVVADSPVDLTNRISLLHHPTNNNDDNGNHIHIQNNNNIIKLHHHEKSPEDLSKFVTPLHDAFARLLPTTVNLSEWYTTITALMHNSAEINGQA